MTQNKGTRKKYKKLTDPNLLEIDRFLRGYDLGKKILEVETCGKEFFCGEAFGEKDDVLSPEEARANMEEVRLVVLSMDRSVERLFLYYHYISGLSMEGCSELLNLSRSTAFRTKRRALLMAADHKQRLVANGQLRMSG